jgi:hypothetical protein
MCLGDARGDFEQKIRMTVKLCPSIKGLCDFSFRILCPRRAALMLRRVCLWRNICRAGGGVARQKMTDTLEKVFWGGEQNFLGLLMRFKRGDVRDHVASQQTDHGASYRRCEAWQSWSRSKIEFCEIFDVVRFRLFQQYRPIASLRRQLPHCEGYSITSSARPSNAPARRGQGLWQS